MAHRKAAAGSGGLCPYIAVRDAAAAIEFYKQAFGAKELFRLVDPASGKIGHAELALGKGILMLSDEYPDFGALSPDSVGGSPVKLHLDVMDAEVAFAAAIKAGAIVVRKLELQFHGCKQGLVADPFGFTWFISEEVEDTPPSEMQKRWNEMSVL
ncbi:MAG: VOC family protein [Aestuariivirga sp.]